ncbi:MAG: ABC transporter permease [Ignisphaera sp.]|nr:ABC transporter permease [Ignisphaera sp.]MCX8167603.1 ABC transporter permease [Ignisphaera sp.]MDW8085423.1 ABC transporter permease [Ignisphaera sp.]
MGVIVKSRLGSLHNLVKTSKKFSIGFTIVLVIAILSIVGFFNSPYHMEGWGIVTEEAMGRQGLAPCLPFYCPNANHVFGTDDMGRDLLSRILVGAHLALIQTVTVVFTSIALGVLMGIAAGYSNTVVEKLSTYLIELLIIIPSMVLAAALIAIIGRGIQSVIIALILTWSPWYARLTYILVRQLRELDFIKICEAMGFSRTYIAYRHIVPNVAPLIFIEGITDSSSVLIEIASINFLIGAASLTSIDLPDWGMIVGYGIRYVRTFWWISFFPGLFIALTALGLILLGDGLSETLSPWLKRRWKLWF